MFNVIDIKKNARFVRQLHSGRQELCIACVCTDGTVLAVDGNGAILWETTIDCYPYDFWVGDMNQDGKDELIIAGSDGVVHAFSAEGEALWQYQTGGPLFQVCAVAMGRNKVNMVFAGGADHFLYALTPSGILIEKKELPETQVNGPHGPDIQLTGRGAVKFIRAGNIDGSGENTLIVSQNMRIMHHDLLFFKGENLTQTNRISNFEMDFSGVAFRNLEIFDIDGDGIEELVVGHGSWKGGGFWVFNMMTQTRIWKSIHEAHAMHRCDTLYRDTRVLSLEVNGEQRVIAHCGHQMSVLNSKLEIIQQAYAPCAFMGISSWSHGTTKGVLLASGFGGDENIYQLEFDGAWVNEYDAFSRVGKMAEVSRQIEVIRHQIVSASADSASIENREPYIIQVGCCYIFKHRLGELHHYIKHNQWVRRQFPYSNMKFATMVAISEKQKNGGGHGLLGDRFDADEVVQILKNFEDGETPFMLYLAQGLGISLTAPTLERIVEVCPTTFLGCYCAETGLHEPLTAASKKLYEDFLDESLLSSLDVLAKHRKKFIMDEKFCFWISNALLEGTFDRLFQEKYRDVVIPCVEDSSSCSPELNLAGRVGLWMAGKVNRWGTRTTNDDYGNEFIWQGGNPVMSGHQSLRKVTAHAALGASVFMFNCGQDNGSGEPCYKPSQGDVFFWTLVGWESAVPFIHLLGKGLLIPPQREEMSGVARVGLAIRPSDRFGFTANNVCMNEYFDGSTWEDEHVFSRLAGAWAMSSSHPNHFSSYVFNQKRQGTNFVPSTPYGFVAIVPRNAIHGNVLEIAAENGRPELTLSVKYETDGEAGMENGKTVLPSDWRRNFLSDLKESRKLLPFVAEGYVFMNAIRETDGYTICIVDAECELLHDKEVTLSIQDKNITCVTDKLSGETLPVTDNRICLKIPAGTFRILSAF